MLKKIFLCIPVVLFVFVVLLAACTKTGPSNPGANTPTATPTATITATFTVTATATLTSTPVLFYDFEDGQQINDWTATGCMTGRSQSTDQKYTGAYSMKIDCTFVDMFAETGTIENIIPRDLTGRGIRYAVSVPNDLALIGNYTLTLLVVTTGGGMQTLRTDTLNLPGVTWTEYIHPFTYVDQAHVEKVVLRMEMGNSGPVNWSGAVYIDVFQYYVP